MRGEERQSHVMQKNRRGNGRKIAAAATLLPAGVALAGCDVEPPQALDSLLRMGWPQGVTPEAESMGYFWVWVWCVAWLVGIVMWGLFLWAIFRWGAKRAQKQGKGEFPRQTQYNIPLELVLTAVPVVIVMGLFFFTVQTQNQVTALDKDPKVTVDVTGFQWNWKFGYAGVDGELTGDGQFYDGTDEQRQAAAEDTAVNEDGDNPIHGKSRDDFSYLNYNEIETVGTTDEIPVLVLPTQRAIEFRLASSDVAHSFWVPEFLFKRDVYAHPETNSQQRSFQIEEITEEGAFVGRCAEMCGTYHAMMNFEIRAVSPEQFTQYLEFRRDNPDAPNSEALAAIGEEPFATSTKPFNSDRVGTREGANTVEASAK